MKPTKQQMIALGVAGALIYVAQSKYVKSSVLKTAMVSIAAIGAAKNLPVIGDQVRQYA